MSMFDGVLTGPALESPDMEGSTHTFGHLVYLYTMSWILQAVHKSITFLNWPLTSIIGSNP